MRSRNYPGIVRLNLRDMVRYQPHPPYDERGRSVISANDGPGGEKPSTLDELSRTMKVTRERIRGIRNDALRRFWKTRNRTLLIESASGGA